MFIVFVLFILSILLIIKGGDLFTDGAIWLATYTGVPQVIIGATVVSLATTVPEFTITVLAALTGHPDLAVGNVIGSSTVNIGLILSLSIIISPLVVTAFMRKGSLIMVFTGIVFVLLLQNKVITSINAVYLLAMLIAYFIYNFRQIKAPKSNLSDSLQINFEIISKDNRAFKKNIFSIIIGASLIIIGSRLLINNGSKIADFLGVPELIIGLTLIALGTSLPELVTAVSSALKKNPEIGIGNVLGANFLNMTMTFGGTALIAPIPINNQTLTLDAPFMLILMAATAAFMTFFKKLNIIHGLIILSLYIIYLYLIVLNSYIHS
ncbi:MAG: calcium/sodium antiporter [Bacillota bacterium]